ncbi:MAG TPA: hypothetical protein VHE55_19845 [Fimbriimonadaceae bacterium]|nr:hypothetical protein [Fimbriimonadaceae bacterium]
MELKMQYTPDPGWTVVDYTWGPLWNSGNVSVAVGIAVEGDGKGQTVHGGCYGAGIAGCNCTVHIHNNATGVDSFPVFTSTCAAIGGPLTFSPESLSYNYAKDSFSSYDNNNNPLPYKYQAGPFTDPATMGMPDHDDNNNSKPYHLQYFGFDPTGQVPTDFQAPRARLTVTATGQPPLTTYTWTVSDPAIFKVTSGGTTSDATLVGSAVGPGAATVKCSYALTYTNLNGTASGSVDDDTDTTPYDVVRAPTVLMVRTINCHEPTDTTKQSWKPYWPAGVVNVTPTGETVVGGGSAAGECDEIALVSQLGVHMPGVWVQERFTSPASAFPPDFAVNPGTGAMWSTAGTGDIAHLGNFYYDYIFYNWTLNTPATWNSFSLNHHYWAATKSVSGGGIDVGSWTMSFTRGAPYQLGSVSHTK